MIEIPDTLVAFIICLVVITIVPLIALTERVDNVEQERVKLIVEKYVTEVQNEARFTREGLQQLETELNAGGSNYEIDLRIYKLDENPGKKALQGDYVKIGENGYVVYYFTQATSMVGIKTSNDKEPVSTENVKTLGKGDRIYLGVKNTNSTNAQNLKKFFSEFFKCW